LTNELVTKCNEKLSEVIKQAKLDRDRFANTIALYTTTEVMD